MNKTASQKMIIKVAQTLESLNATIPVVYDKYKGEEITDDQKETYKDFKQNTAIIIDALVRASKMKGIATPKSVYIPRTKDKQKLLSIMFKSSDDPEHGKAFVYSDGKYLKEGPQDIIL